MAAPDRFEEVLGLLRANGGRVTGARRAILRALIDHGPHPTAEQLTAQVKDRHPDTHESTVYRFLDDLERLGVIDHVHLGHGPAVYHFADDTHHHLVCDACGVVVEVPDRALQGLRRRLRTEFDFEMEPRHFAVPGRCKACAGVPRRASG
jgi:Fur family ferric uptake transcriptional regulator